MSYPSDHSVSFTVTPLAPASLRERHTELPLSVPNQPLSFVSLWLRFLQDRHHPREHAVGWGVVDWIPGGWSCLPAHLHPHPGLPPAPPRYGLLHQELGLGLCRAPAGPGASVLVHVCSWGCGSKARASCVYIVIPKWISPLWVSICLCYCFSLAAVMEGGCRVVFSPCTSMASVASTSRV